GGIAWQGFVVVAAGVVLVLLMQWAGIGRALAYVLPGALIWYGLLLSGVHPTLAGVILGLLTPATAHFGRGRRRSLPRSAERAPLARVAAWLHPSVAFGIMPLFALATAGVTLEGLDLSAGPSLAILAGVVTGLVAGKPIGILMATFVAVRFKLGALP